MSASNDSDIFDTYPDVQYYAAFLDESATKQILKFVNKDVLDRYPFQVPNPHLTLAHCNNRGDKEIQAFITNTYEKRVCLSVKEICMDDNLLMILLDSPPKSVSQGHPHISLRKSKQKMDMLFAGQYCSTHPKETIPLGIDIEAVVRAWSF